MKRLLIAAVAAAALTLGSVSAASAAIDTRSVFDQDCDGKHDITGEPMTGRANGICGG